MRNQNKNRVQLEVDRGDWLPAINRTKHELKKKHYGLEITGSRSAGGWLIWNTINQFTLGHELEVIGAATILSVYSSGSAQPKFLVTVIIDKDFEEELQWFMKGDKDILKTGVANYLNALNNAMKK